MNKQQRVRIYNLHSWTGIALGWVVFFVSFTGCLALFFHELQTWEDPSRRVTAPKNPAAVHQHFTEWVSRAAEGGEITFAGIEFPSDYEPYYVVRASVRVDTETTALMERWRADNLETIPHRGDGMAVWLKDFHRDLMWPTSLGGRTMGRTLVGIVGVILLLSIVTGIVTHRKILKEFFVLRAQRGLRVRWKDTHNVLGIWSLPFSIMIAFTGAFLGVVAILLPLMGTLVMKGDSEALLRALGGGATERTGQPAVMISMDTIRRERHPETGLYPDSVFVEAWGDANARYSINYPDERRLLISRQRLISGVSGEEQPVTFFPTSRPDGRVAAAIAPLHYATYGGFWLKALYFALGIALSIVVAFGIMTWIERRRGSSEGRRSDAYYDRLSRLNAGAMLGVVVASVSLFYFAQLYDGTEESRIVWAGCTYFGAWGITIAFAMLRQDTYATVRHVLTTVGIGALGIPILNGVMTGDWFWALDAPWSMVDLCAGFVGLITLAFSPLLPNPSSNRYRRRQSSLAAAKEA